MTDCDGSFTGRREPERLDLAGALELRARTPGTSPACEPRRENGPRPSSPVGASPRPPSGAAPFRCPRMTARCSAAPRPRLRVARRLPRLLVLGRTRSTVILPMGTAPGSIVPTKPQGKGPLIRRTSASFFGGSPRDLHPQIRMRLPLPVGATSPVSTTRRPQGTARRSRCRLRPSPGVAHELRQGPCWRSWNRCSRAISVSSWASRFLVSITRILRSTGCPGTRAVAKADDLELVRLLLRRVRRPLVLHHQKVAFTGAAPGGVSVRSI